MSVEPVALHANEHALRKAGRRLIPVMAVCYFFAYLDRTNLSVAALTMNDDLNISPRAYGLAAGLLFVGYVLLDVPSNLIMHRVGASRWMMRIMVLWGLIAAAGALVRDEQSLYVVRFLLGLAEAGFFPGMILYLTYWFPAAQRARMVGQFMIAIPLSTAIGAPLGGLLLRLDGVAGLHGWQWLFIAEGLPSVALGIMLLWLLPDRPANATWLTPAESASLTATLDAENAAVASRNPISVRKTLGHPRVLALALVYFTVAFGVYGLGFWMPQIIKTSLGISDNLTVTLLTAIPYAAGAIAMVSWGRWCDRRGHAAMFTVLPMAAGGVALASSALVTSSPWLGYLGLCVCAACVMAAFPAFWTLPTSFLTGAAVAAGIGIVNSIGNLAGFVGPYWVGWTTSAFGSPRWGLVTIGCVMVAGAVLVGVLRTSADVPDSRAVPNTGPVPASSL